MRSKVFLRGSDIQLQIQADNLPELFRAGLEGMNNLLLSSPMGMSNYGLHKTTSVHVTSHNIPSLLTGFLARILSRSYLHKTIYYGLVIEQLSETEVKANLTGSPIQRFDEYIKKITYSEAEVDADKHQLSTVLLFDI